MKLDDSSTVFLSSIFNKTIIFKTLEYSFLKYFQFQKKSLPLHTLFRENYV